jgi:hypothetical protein
MQLAGHPQPAGRDNRGARGLVGTYSARLSLESLAGLDSWQDGPGRRLLSGTPPALAPNFDNRER